MPNFALLMSLEDARDSQKHCEFFPFDGADGLGGEVQQDTVDAFYLMGDPVGDLMEDLIGDLLDGCSHCVLGVDSTDDSGPAFVAALVLNTNALDVGNSDEILPNLTKNIAVHIFQD